VGNQREKEGVMKYIIIRHKVGVEDKKYVFGSWLRMAIFKCWLFAAYEVGAEWFEEKRELTNDGK
jgi:hypothetical protein